MVICRKSEKRFSDLNAFPPKKYSQAKQYLTAGPYSDINLCRLIGGLDRREYELEDYIGVVVRGENASVFEILDDTIVYRHANYRRGYGGPFSVILKKQDDKLYYMNQRIKVGQYVINDIDNYQTVGGATMTGLLVEEVVLDDESGP